MKLSRNWRVPREKRAQQRDRRDPFLRSWEVITISQDPQVKWQSRDTDSPGVNRRKFAIDVRSGRIGGTVASARAEFHFLRIFFISNISCGGAVVAYEAHNLVVGGSNPPRATNIRAPCKLSKKG